MAARNICIFITMAMVAACSDQPEWKGWVYPNASFLPDDIPIGRFTSLQECRASARALLARLDQRRDDKGNTITGDYECGYRCEQSDLPGLNVCERTEK